MESLENVNPKEEDGIDVGDLSSNLEGYPETKGKNEKGNEETISDGNSKQSNSVNEGNQAVSSGGDKGEDKIVENPIEKSKEDHMEMLASPAKGIEEQKKMDSIHNGFRRRIRWKKRNTLTMSSPPLMR